ncbi:MAG: glycosyltransferase family 4 protein [Ktedonobacterales bacterium]
MKVIIAHSQLNRFGGGERSTLALLQNLETRHDVELWTSGYHADQTYPELARFPRRLLRPFEWLTVRPEAGAVVIAQTFGANLLALRHARTICYLHTQRSRYLQGDLRPDLAARRLLDRASIANAARILTNSEYSSRKIAERYGSHAEVVPPGVTAEFFAARPSVGSYALYVGRLAPEKGLERLLDWCREAALELAVAGGGEPRYVAHLQTMAGPLTHFMGPVTGAALCRLYAGCRFLAFLPYGEEFGLAALEAMAAAKPVLAAREGALPELVTDQLTGFLVDNRQDFEYAAASLAGDDALCLRLGTQGRMAARPYSWERFAGDIERVCREVAANTAG